ncbi:hypothetical protein CLAIMM_12360 isoform 1, partial [Cladophialophora immunda]
MPIVKPTQSPATTEACLLLKAGRRRNYGCCGRDQSGPLHESMREPLAVRMQTPINPYQRSKTNPGPSRDLHVRCSRGLFSPEEDLMTMKRYEVDKLCHPEVVLD